MEFGLTENDLQLIRSVCAEFPAISSVTIFGSRAMGNFKTGSDVDLAVAGNLPSGELSKLRMRLNDDLPLPYVFDIFDLSAITNTNLLDHIQAYGKLLYKRVAG